MRRSSEKILTTHIGSLPDFVVLDPAASDHDAKLASAVGDAIKRQREVGLGGEEIRTDEVEESRNTRLC